MLTKLKRIHFFGNTRDPEGTRIVPGTRIIPENGSLSRGHDLLLWGMICCSGSTRYGEGHTLFRGAERFAKTRRALRRFHAATGTCRGNFASAGICHRALVAAETSPPQKLRHRKIFTGAERHQQGISLDDFTTAAPHKNAPPPLFPSKEFSLTAATGPSFMA